MTSINEFVLNKKNHISLRKNCLFFLSSYIMTYNEDKKRGDFFMTEPSNQKRPTDDRWLNQEHYSLFIAYHRKLQSLFERHDRLYFCLLYAISLPQMQSYFSTDEFDFPKDILSNSKIQASDQCLLDLVYHFYTKGSHPFSMHDAMLHWNDSSIKHFAYLLRRIKEQFAIDFPNHNQINNETEEETIDPADYLDDHEYFVSPYE